MPLPHDVTMPLDISSDDFNSDAIAVIDFTGARYGGHWVINARVRGTKDSAGEIDTCYDLSRDDLTKQERYPNLAVDTALVWLSGEVKKRGWRLLTWDNLNEQYGPDERPFFMAAQAAIGSDAFEPVPGVTYADEIIGR